MVNQIKRTSVMLALVAGVALLTAPAPTNAEQALVHVSSGVLSQYAPGKMQEVINVRQQHGRTAYNLPRELPGVFGYIAMPSPESIGRTVLVCVYGDLHQNSELIACELFLVTDCAGVADGGLAWMQRNGIIGEVDYLSAEALGFVGRGVYAEIYRVVEDPRWR